MRLHSIKLTNFRQFRGEQSFDLTTTPEKPVVLIFGANGGGKTTLLNAFVWALYGSLTEDVEFAERMVTNSLWRQTSMGEAVEFGVEITFDHEGHNYRLQRSVIARKQSDEQQKLPSEPKLWETLSDGSSKEVLGPQEKILTILPQGVSRFFFFNGERIEKLVQKGAYGEVQRDIKALLDLEQVDRAIERLPKINKRFTDDIRKHGGEKASIIQAEIDQLTEEDEQACENLGVLEGQIAELESERNEVLNLLREHQQVAPLQKQRDEVTNDLQEARIAKHNAEDEQKALISSQGFLAFTDDVALKAGELASALYKKGTLPAPLKREFVEKLLEDERCICDTPLTEHSDAWQHVQDWRQRAGLAAVETAWQRLGGQLEPMAGARRALHDSLQLAAKRIADETDRVARLEGKLSDLNGQLKDTRYEDAAQLEGKRVDLDERLADRQRARGKVQERIDQLQREIAAKQNVRRNAEVTDSLAAKARNRSDLVQNVLKALREIRTIRAEDMRIKLDAELKSVFGTISIKQYTPRLSMNLELGLYQELDGVEMAVAKSTGENQILSLSFVGAVSKLAREIRKESRAEGAAPTDAGIYPIVMDAAFGSLDENYQRDVSRTLAKMAPQLVVLVSKSQGMGNVLHELLPYINSLGLIETNTNKDGFTDEDIELRGFTHPYIRHSDDDHSVLKEIK